MFIAIYLIVLFAGTAMMVREGLWSNAIALVNIVFSGLVAFGFYSPLTIWLDEYTDGQYTYILDFVVLWFLYAVTMVVCRTVTNAASRTRMRFKHPIDPIGGPAVGLLAGWVLAAIVMTSLHLSPIPNNAGYCPRLVKSADVATASAFTSPDAAWIRFLERVRQAGAFGFQGGEAYFGARGWVKIYEDHRTALQAAPGIRVSRTKK